MAVMLPLFFLAMYEKDVQPLEVVAKHFYEAKFKRPKTRPYKTKNYYALLVQQADAEMEVNRIVQNGKKQERQSGAGISTTAAMTRQRSFFAASVAEELLLNTELTEESIDRAIHLLKEFGLYEYRDAHPSTLSGGQKQRLAIACAVFSAPDGSSTAMVVPLSELSSTQTEPPWRSAISHTRESPSPAPPYSCLLYTSPSPRD